MSDITTADLLRVQEAIATTVRHEVGLAREDFREKFEELNGRYDGHQTILERQGRELARLDERTKLSSRGLFASLSKKQKAALGTLAVAAGGVVLDGVRHLGALILTALQHGARP